MKQEVLLVMPPLVPISFFKEKNLCKDVIESSPPLGLLSISAYVKARVDDVVINIIDLNLEVLKGFGKGIKNVINDSLIKYSKDHNPVIVGISCIFNSSAGYLGLISGICRGLWGEAVIVVGGGYPTNMYKEIFVKTKDVDGIVVGEGEKPFLSLVKSKDKESYLDRSPYWVTSKKLLKGFIPKKSLLMNLDGLPVLPYELIKLGDYSRFLGFHGKKDKGTRFCSLITSRGCPFNCVFCSSHSVHGKKVRLMSPGRVIEEVIFLVKNYGVNTILIEDDNFFVDKIRGIRILRKLSEMDLFVEFQNGVAIYNLDEEVVSAMKSSGVRMVTIAVESGVDRVLKDVIHKPLNTFMVRKAVKILRKGGMYVRAFFIIGFPGETKKDMRETIGFMKRVGFNWSAIMIATPLAGSELYDICKDKGYLPINKGYEDFHYSEGNIITPDFTPEEVESIRYLANLEVNFVYNYDMRRNDYRSALIGFKDVLSRVSDHAFAHYFISICYEKIGLLKKSNNHMKKYFSIINDSVAWRGYAKHFSLPIKKMCGGGLL